MELVRHGLHGALHGSAQGQPQRLQERIRARVCGAIPVRVSGIIQAVSSVLALESLTSTSIIDLCQETLEGNFLM